MKLTTRKGIAWLGMLCMALACEARAENWWKAPLLKATIPLASGVGNGPHYWNMDESEQFLFATTGYNDGDWGYLFAVDDLRNAEGVSPVAPIASGESRALAPFSYGLRGGAISDDLGRVLSGNAYEGDGRWWGHASLPTDGSAWNRSSTNLPATVFGISNNVSIHVVWDSADFSHDSAYLYSNDYLWDIIPGESERIWKWEVGDLEQDGMGLASNAVYSTQVLGIWSLSVYHIGGRDLIYYGGLDHAKSNIIVCAFDTVDETEHVLLSLPNTLENNAYFGAWNDFEIVQNVKVSGIGSDAMHLHVADDVGNIRIYRLRQGGKQAGGLVAHLTPAMLAGVLGFPALGNCRVLEVTNDGATAFFSMHGQRSVFVLHSHPVAAMLILR